MNEESLRTFIESQKAQATAERDRCAEDIREATNEIIKQVFQAKMNQAVGYLDALEDIKAALTPTKKKNEFVEFLDELLAEQREQ